MQPNSDDDGIKGAVRQLWAAWTRKPNEEEQAAWVQALRPYWSRSSLREAMRESSVKDDWVPSISQLIKRMHGIEGAASKSDGRAPRLTEAERRKSTRAAVLSMLWLHYELGWSFEQLGEHIMANAFGGNAVAAVAAAKEQYTQATVRRWMADQAANNPAPCDKTLGKYLAG